jgi:CHAD domain-containing protein
MAAGISSAHPIETLRSQSTRLEHVLAACLAKPSPAAVHRLRTTIRRIEAQTKLLTQLSGLPPHDRESRTLRKRLKKLRRLAGKVRDLDVQLDLIATKSAPDTDSESRRLRRLLKHQRDDQAVILLDYARRAHGDVSLALESLTTSLRSVEQFDLPISELVVRTKRWFARRYSPPVSQNQLHTTRKLAKLARYMLESAQNSVTAQRMAKKFEDIQHKGGQWHDWLQLAATASDMLEPTHPLIKLYEQERDVKLRRYRKALAEQHRQLVDLKHA